MLKCMRLSFFLKERVTAEKCVCWIYNKKRYLLHRVGSRVSTEQHVHWDCFPEVCGMWLRHCPVLPLQDGTCAYLRGLKGHGLLFTAPFDLPEPVVIAHRAQQTDWHENQRW